MREIFIEKTELIGRRMDVAGDAHDSNELADDKKVSLCEIGSDLLSRYNVCYYEEGNGERLQEWLIDDFLEMNGDALADMTTSDSFSTKRWVQHSRMRLLAMMTILVIAKTRSQATMRLRKQGKTATRSGATVQSCDSIFYKQDP
jgi:hypothetical protein